jgi:hypothetical protein
VALDAIAILAGMVILVLTPQQKPPLRTSAGETHRRNRRFRLTSQRNIIEQAEHSDRAKSFIGRVANRSREIFMPLNTPAQWKVRAQEARVLAEALKAHPEAFAAMLKIADEYERLADRAAQRLIDDAAGAK